MHNKPNKKEVLVLTDMCEQLTETEAIELLNQLKEEDPLLFTAVKRSVQSRHGVIL